MDLDAGEKNLLSETLQKFLFSLLTNSVSREIETLPTQKFSYSTLDIGFSLVR